MVYSPLCYEAVFEHNMVSSSAHNINTNIHSGLRKETIEKVTGR